MNVCSFSALLCLFRFGSIIDPSLDRGRCLRREVRTEAGGAVPVWEGENIVNGGFRFAAKLSWAGYLAYARGGHHPCKGDVERSRRLSDDELCCVYEATAECYLFSLNDWSRRKAVKLFRLSRPKWIWRESSIVNFYHLFGFLEFQSSAIHFVISLDQDASSANTKYPFGGGAVSLAYAFVWRYCSPSLPFQAGCNCWWYS